MKNRMPVARRLTLCVALLLLARATDAHHSATMFDETKSFTVKGIVKSYLWTNPHTWLTATVTEKGKAVDYSLEGQSPNILVRRGWKPGSIKAGDTVTVVGRPLRSGERGGALVSVTFADGTQLKTAY